MSSLATRSDGPPFASTRARRGMDPFGWRALVVVALVAAAIAIGWQQWSLAGDFRIDDAYITFAFAKNLAHGHGPVFSHGVVVEGYSNFLWMALMAIPFAFGASDPYPFARVLGALSLGVLVLVTYRLARTRSAAVFALGAAVIVLECTDLFRAARSGLETASYAAALATATLVYLDEPPRSRRASLYGFVVVALLRIDGMVPLVFVLGFEVASAIVERRFSWRSLARWAVPPLSVYLAYFAWRYHTYGLPLPSTYYAKQLVASDPARGPVYAWGAVRALGVLALAPFVALAVLTRVRRRAAFLGLYVAVHAGYVIHVGGDWMPFDRFWLPIVPFVAVLAAWGFAAAWNLASRARWPVQVLVALAIASAFRFTTRRASAATIETPEEAQKVGLSVFITRLTTDELMGDVPFLRLIIRDPNDRLVTDYAGVFGVEVDAAIIDMWGLCNATIAVRGNAEGIQPMYGKTCVPCYVELRPTYFHTITPLVRARDSFRGQGQIIDEIFQGPALDRVIDLRHAFAAGRVTELSTGRTLWFLERRRRNFPLGPRVPRPGWMVDYPFEGGGARP